MSNFTPRRLALSDSFTVDSAVMVNKQDSFYHYFPLIFALSESTSPLTLSERGWLIELNPDTVLFDNGYSTIPKRYKTVLISQNKPPAGFEYKIYDHNFIYDLATTIQIKNFRGNAHVFECANKELEHIQLEYIPVTKANIDLALAVVKEWYSKSKREAFGDFGYTLWLCQNSLLFSDLKARLVLAKSKPIGYTLFGKIREGLAVHLISKDIGWSYLQDYMRMKTYREMIELGFKEVNDGSSVGEEGIYHYKLKLRPKYIYPLFTWERA